MCRHWLLLFLLIVNVLATYTLIGSGRSLANDGWINLFDSRTLKGWHTNRETIGKSDTGGRWVVEDGMISGEQNPPGSGIGGVLLSDRKFGDFEMEVDVKPDWGICSGLFVRCAEKGPAYQIMVDYHDDGNVGHIHGELCGSWNNRPFLIDGKCDVNGKLTGLTTKPSGLVIPKAYSIKGGDWIHTWRPDDWNRIKVRIIGTPPMIISWINGVRISEFNGETYDGPRYDKERVTNLLGSAGSIAFQVHGGSNWPVGAKCRWKGVRVKPL